MGNFEKMLFWGKMGPGIMLLLKVQEVLNNLLGKQDLFSTSHIHAITAAE